MNILNLNTGVTSTINNDFSSIVSLYNIIYINTYYINIRLHSRYYFIYKLQSSYDQYTRK